MLCFHTDSLLHCFCAALSVELVRFTGVLHLHGAVKVCE